jgi:site-specific DNA recombinase
LIRKSRRLPTTFLARTYADSEVVNADIERWQSRAAEKAPDSASQLRDLEAEIWGTKSAVERYYSAFENGRLSESRFGSRVDALERRLIQLRAKCDELRDSRAAVEAPSKEAVRSAEEAVRDAMLHGTPGQRKALLKELIVEVRVESRDSIIPTFRLPATPVRVTETIVGRSLHNANQLTVRGRRFTL